MDNAEFQAVALFVAWFSSVRSIIQQTSKHIDNEGLRCNAGKGGSKQEKGEMRVDPVGLELNYRNQSNVCS